MSGMEPMVAFGLVCNVMQVIHFTSEVVAMSKEAFRTGSPDPELTQLAADSAQLYQDLARSIRSANPLTQDEFTLLQIAGKTRDAAAEVNKEVRRIMDSSPKGDVLASVIGGIKARLREGKLDKLEKRVQAYQRLLESGFLHLICKKSDALSLQQDSRFNDLDDSFRNFIQSYSQGETKLEKLLLKQGDRIEDIIRTETFKSQQTITNTLHSESSRTRQEMSDIFKKTSAEPPRWQQREKLLRSLKYESMSDRLNQIHDPLGGSYQWIMGGLRPWFLDEGVEITRFKDYPKSLPDCPHEIPAPVSIGWDCFPCWLDSNRLSDKVYWVQGIPGCGKSTLMKFLISEKSVWDYIKPSSPHPIILFHFFWAAGHHKQKSIRGLLLSLIFQFLSLDEQILDEVLDIVPRAKFKDVDGDWTSREMEEFIETWFPKSEKPIFILLDGLDEMNSDDITPLFLLISKWSKVEAVKKLCVSSRPEQIYKDYLGTAPTLRVHKHIALDMKAYAKLFLLEARPSLKNTSELDDMIDTLLEMADGVFLYLSLVVKSVCRGLVNGDNMQEIKLRLKKTPNGLYSLYQDMWSRLNDDESIYREEGALYLNIFLDWKCLRLPDLSCFHFLLASQPVKLEGIFRGNSDLSPSTFSSLSKDMMKRIETRTAGLLWVMWDREQNLNGVQMVHRSTLEFFQNTAEGQTILKHDKTPPQLRRKRVLLSLLAETWLVLTTGRGVWPLPDYDAGLVLRGVYDAWSEGYITKDDALEIFSWCKQLNETGKWQDQAPNPPLPKLDFVGLAAVFDLPDLLSWIIDEGALGFKKDFRWPRYRAYLLCAALANSWRLVKEGTEVRSKVVEILTRDQLVHEYNKRDEMEGPEKGLATRPLPNTHDADKELSSQKSNLVILLSLLDNKSRWPTTYLRLPEAIKHYTLQCQDILQEKVFVTLLRDGLNTEFPPTGPQQHLFSFSIHYIQTDTDVRDPSWTPHKTSWWITLEMNIVSLVELHLLAMSSHYNQDDNPDVEISRRVLAELRQTHLHQSSQYIKVAAIHTLERGRYKDYWGNDCEGELEDSRVKYPATEDDCEYLLSCLDTIRPVGPDRPAWSTGPKDYIFPGLSDRLQEVGPRCREIDLGTYLDALSGNALAKMCWAVLTNPLGSFAEQRPQLLEEVVVRRTLLEA